MKTTKTITATAITAVLLLTGCSVETDTQATPAPSPTQEVEVEQEEPEPTEEIDITDVEPEPEPLEPGDIVAEEDVEAAREAGATIYVSPNGGGTGLVIDPEATELPEPVRQDIEALPGNPGQNATEHGQQNRALTAQGLAMEDAGLVAFFIARAAQFESGQLVGSEGYWVGTMGIGAETREFAAEFSPGVEPTKEGAIANVQPLMDRYPDAPLIDLT